MRVQCVIDVSPLDRYLIARYFHLTTQEQMRRRATREQVRRFLRLAMTTVLSDKADAATGRAKSVVRKLRGQAPEPEDLVAPENGRQPTLW